MTQRNPAVQHCIEARELAMKDARSQKLERFYIERAGNRAFLDAMPDLSGHQNVTGFIACTAYALLIEPLDEHQSSKLLYAAQVALSALRQLPKEEQRPAACPPLFCPKVTSR